MVELDEEADRPRRATTRPSRRSGSSAAAGSRRRGLRSPASSHHRRSAQKTHRARRRGSALGSRRPMVAASVDCASSLMPSPQTSQLNRKIARLCSFEQAIGWFPAGRPADPSARRARVALHGGSRKTLPSLLLRLALPHTPRPSGSPRRRCLGRSRSAGRTAPRMCAHARRGDSGAHPDHLRADHANRPRDPFRGRGRNSRGSTGPERHQLRRLDNDPVRVARRPARPPSRPTCPRRTRPGTALRA